MSLKNIGELGEYASALNEVNSLADLIQTKQATEEQKEAFKSIRESLKGLDVDAASKRLQDLKLNKNLSKELLTAARNSDLLSGSTDEINKGIENFQNTSSIVDDLGSTFTGLGSAVKSGLSSIISFATANPYIAALIGIGAALTTAIVISGQFIETYDEANEKAKESAKAYEETQNTLHSLNSELQTTQERLEELQKLQDSGSITATEKEELETLKNKNVELERELKIQEKIAELQRQEANTDAINALNKTDASVASMYDDKGNKYHTGTKIYDANVSSKTDAEALEESTQKIGTFKKEIGILQEKQFHTKTQKEFDKIQKDIDRYNAAIKDLEADMITRSQNISDHLQNVSDKTSKVYEDNSNALDKYLNEDLSKTENQIVSMKESLDGSTTLTFEANLDGVQTSIERVTSPNGIVSFQADINGVRGGFIGDMIRAAGEDGIALVRRGEGIIPTNMVPEWNALIHHLPQINHSVLCSIPEQKPNISIDFGDIQMYGVNDPEEFTRQLKHVMLNNNSIRNIMKDTTLGEALGKNSMIRYTR